MTIYFKKSGDKKILTTFNQKKKRANSSLLNPVKDFTCSFKFFWQLIETKPLCRELLQCPSGSCISLLLKIQLYIPLVNSPSTQNHYARSRRSWYSSQNEKSGKHAYLCNALFYFKERSHKDGKEWREVTMKSQSKWPGY